MTPTWRLVAGLIASMAVFGGPAVAETVRIEFDRTSPQISYAADRLIAAVEHAGHSVDEMSRPDAFPISIEIADGLIGEGAFSTTAASRSLRIVGGDGSGAIYGALSVAEQLKNGTALGEIPSELGRPQFAFRAIKHNLPWDSYRSSSALDQHYETVRDVAYWEAFLDMMVENRFNALTLWNLHPFPYMIRAKNFPEAGRFTDAELAEWRTLYRSIFRMAKERGIETYLVNWNILVSREFAAAHGLKGNSFWPNYKGEAETGDLVRQYTRESVTQLLNEYPDLTGFGFSFGEQMAGLTPRERQEWMDETIIAGMRDADRPVKMIFRAPFSADLGQGGSTDVATEQLTRTAIEKLEGFDGPIWMEIKFNWSHGHSTTDLVKVHGGELKDTYFEPLPRNYRIAWMLRNEDFYALRWGNAGFIREHLRKNGKQGYVGGYFVGSENYIPAKDYFTAVDAPVDWTYAFERQWLFYKLWGRLLYDPGTPDEIFEAEFTRRYGTQATPLLDAYAQASSIQLDFATSIDFSWDATLYSEGMMVLGRQGMAPMTVERLIVQPMLKDNWLSVEDFVARRQAGENLVAGIVTPLLLAERMEANAARALDLVAVIDTEGNASLMYEVADVRIWAHLGLYYADKLRGAVALETYRTTGDEAEKRSAVGHLGNALAHWDEVIAITRPIYKDMPLAHHNPPDNQRSDDNLFHWALERPVIAADVEVARKALFVGR